MNLVLQRESRNEIPGVSGAERRWVIWFGAVVMTVTTIPYLLGYTVQGMDLRFTGFVFGIGDGNSYLAKMLTGTYGAWLFRSPYTAYPQVGMLIYLPYILLGKLTAPPGLHEQLVALYHLYRIASGLLAVMATYELLAFFLRDIRLRRFGLALVILGGGLGWPLVLSGVKDWLGSLPLDFYSPESFGFLGLYGVPHLAMARALMLWVLLAYLKVATYRLNLTPGVVNTYPLRFRSALTVSLLWLLAGLMQPLDAVVLGMVILWHLVGLASWQVLRFSRGHCVDWDAWWWLVRFVVLAGALPALFVLYNLWMSFHDPYIAAWMAQNAIRSPHPVHYLLAYGLILPYAWVGGRNLLHTDRCKGWLLVGWIILLPLLAYLPVNLQRRLPDGMWVAWVTLAMVGLEKSTIKDDTSSPWKRLLPFAPLCFLFFSTLVLIAGGFRVSLRAAQPLFRSADEVAVFEHLQANAEPGSVVLAAIETGNPLPAWAPVHVLIGHGPESAKLTEIQPQVRAFYSATTPDEQRFELLTKFDVNYVFWGPAERALGEWDPRQARYLALEYRSGEYALFKLLP